MLAKFLSKRIQILSKNCLAFSSSPHKDHHDHLEEHHDHDHHHHDYSVHIDKDSPWIKYKSDPKFVSFFGVEDTNYKLQPLLKDDPFEHLKNQPFFSWNRFVYNDPWYHDDSHEPYNSLPGRGYSNGQDPLQTRSFYSPNANLVKIIFAGVLIYIGVADKDITYMQAVTYNDKMTRDFVIEDLSNLNKQIIALKNKEAELQQSLASQ